MRNKAEVSHRVLVAKGSNAVCKLHQSGDSRACRVAKLAVFYHHALAVLHQAHVHMHARTGLTSGNFRCEGNVHTHLIGQVANNPLGNHQLISGFFYGYGQEFNFVLLVNQSVLAKITHLRVSVFNLSAGLSDVRHAKRAEVVCFSIGHRLVVTALVNSGEHLLVGCYHVIFQFAHSMKFHTRNLAESLSSLGQGVFGRAF